MNGIRLVVGLVVMALVAAVTAPVAAQDDQTSGEAPTGELRFLPLLSKLEAGPWLGSGTAEGGAVSSSSGVQIDWTGDLTATFFFDVTLEGDVSGEWDVAGPITNHMEGSVGGIDLKMDMEASFAGSGAVEGVKPTLFRVRGQSTVDGIAVIESQGQTLVQTIDSQPVIPFIEITPRYGWCNEVYGDWIASFNQNFEDLDFFSQMTGSWVAVRQVDMFRSLSGPEQAALVDDLVDVVDDAKGFFGVDDTGFGDEPGVIAQRAGWATMADLVTRANNVSNQLRNLTECQRELFGAERIEKWLNVLSALVYNVANVALLSGEIDGSLIRLLVSAGLNTGAIGAGSVIDGAAETMEGLRLAAEGILNDAVYIDPEVEAVGGGTCGGGGCILATDEVIDILVAGAQAGWEFDVKGRNKDPAEMLATADIVAEPAQ